MIKTRWVDKQTKRSISRQSLPAGGEGGEQRNDTEEESANFFASTPPLPPLEAVKFLITEAITKRISRNNRPLKLSVIDVKKAHLCSEVLRVLYVEPPLEANEPPNTVWRLQRAMYGTRDTAAAMGTRVHAHAEDGGFESGKSNPVLLRDDFITLVTTTRSVKLNK